MAGNPPQWAVRMNEQIQELEERIRGLQTENTSLQARAEGLERGRHVRRDRLLNPPTFKGKRSEYVAWRTQLRAKLTVDMSEDSESVRF